MGLMNGIGAGLSAMGGGVAQFAETAGLQQQKEALEEQQIKLSSQLAGQQYDVQQKKLALIPQAVSVDAYLKAAGHPGGLSDFGMNVDGGGGAAQTSSGTPASSSEPISGNDDVDRTIAQDAGGGATGTGGTMSGGPVGAGGNPSFPQGAPVVTPIGDKGKVMGVPLPPGWTPTMAAIAGPQALSAAWEKFSAPGAIRPGSAIPYFDFNTGKMETLYQQPNTPEGYLYDAASKSYVQIGHGLEAVNSSSFAKSAGTAGGSLSADLTKIGATGEQARTTAAFTKGLDVATELVPSYDPATQRTTMVTKADALKLTKAGNGVIAPPANAAPQPVTPGQQPGLGKDGSYTTPDGTIIPAPPKVAAPAAGYQTEPSAAQKATQANYADTIKGWQDSVIPATQSEQRFQAQAEALKAMESGKWATAKADVGAHLIAAGLPKDTVDSILNADPAQAQIIMKNNFGASLSTLSASKLGRITQNEIFAMQKNLANPDLQPEANLAIIGQGIGIARFQEHLANDWNTAIQLGYSDPASYQEAWIKANPLQKFIDDATKEIGPLKGMTPAQVQLPEMKDREVGKTYPTPTGPHIWMGNGWAPAGQDQQAP